MQREGEKGTMGLGIGVGFVLGLEIELYWDQEIDLGDAPNAIRFEFKQPLELGEVLIALFPRVPNGHYNASL